MSSLLNRCSRCSSYFRCRCNKCNRCRCCSIRANSSRNSRSHNMGCNRCRSRNTTRRCCSRCSNKRCCKKNSRCRSRCNNRCNNRCHGLRRCSNSVRILGNMTKGRGERLTESSSPQKHDRNQNLGQRRLRDQRWQQSFRAAFVVSRAPPGFLVLMELYVIERGSKGMSLDARRVCVGAAWRAYPVLSLVWSERLAKSSSLWRMHGGCTSSAWQGPICWTTLVARKLSGWHEKQPTKPTSNVAVRTRRVSKARKPRKRSRKKRRRRLKLPPRRSQFHPLQQRRSRKCLSRSSKPTWTNMDSCMRTSWRRRS
mmetsp:Transcript_3091/g.6949  ORF Transcript_3091/g.6949 Transcript_3091/m.6949 type:complete len:311 (+) Transcript_3091:1609-2541(+)